jgi:phosphoglycerate dehydrogenase-like enzyme
MSNTEPDIVVLRKGTHGLSTKTYAEAIRERLPDFTVLSAEEPQEEREFIRHTPVATGVGITEELLSHAEDLRLFACAFAGYDHLPMNKLAESNVAVTNASGIHASSIADQAIGFILIYTRRLDEAFRRTQKREWRHFQARELTGSTVTVVGMGAVGSEIIKRLQGFETHTVAVRYTPEKGGPADEVIGFDEIHSALAKTEYLVLASPLTETTDGLIGKREFTTLPPDSVVINVARGQIVNTDDLVSALQREQIRAAALDVTDPEPLPADHPLWNFENTIITPHNAGHTPMHWDRLADILARNVRRIGETDAYSELENQVLVPGS